MNPLRAVSLLALASLSGCFDGDVGTVAAGDAGPPATGDATGAARLDAPGDIARADDAGAATDGPHDAQRPADVSADALADVPADAPAATDGGCAAREDCANGLDDDCDGQVDNGCPCVPGATRACFLGDPRLAGRGVCARGEMTCGGAGEFGTWARCEGSIAPSEERCDGLDNDCDGRVDEGFCRIDDRCVARGASNPANPCEVCVAPDDVSAPTSWSVAPPGTTCRPEAGACDIAETCAGTRCPADVFHGAAVTCRPAAGECDLPESCDGAGPSCPADLMRDAGHECRVAAGVCDVPERCTGAAAACPADALAPDTQVCRPSSTVEGCDPAERCTGGGAACPADVVSRGPTEELCDNVDNDCDGLVDESLTRACYTGPSGTEGRGACRGGAQACAAGAWGACAGEVTPRAEVCRNGADEDCNGANDDSCPPCLTGMATTSPWQIHRAMGPVCFGRRFSQHGDPGEYAYAAVPAETDPAWRPLSAVTVDFSEISALCGRSCECLDGGEFTYFQTFIDVTPGYAVSSLAVSMGSVDDGARVTVYNSRHPGGVTDPGAYIRINGTSVTTNLAAYLAPGRNRVLITHIDDCCTARSLAGVSLLVNGQPLADCP